MAVVITGLFPLATCLVVVDLAAWQWLVGRGPVPGWLVVDGALAGAALLVAGLSRLGAVGTGRRFRFAAAVSCDLAPGEGLGDAAFFDGDPDSPALALVTLLWLPPEVRGRVRWVTFGSQLRNQFARGFPHHVTADLLREVGTAFRWISLYRDTDPVAGPVTGRRVCGDEWRLLDPVPADPALQSRAVTRVGGHGGYWTDPDWPLALDVVRGVGGPRLPAPRRGGARPAGDRPGAPVGHQDRR